MRFKYPSYLLIILVFALFSCEEHEDDDDDTQKTETITRFERDGSSILKGVKVPTGNSMYFASGIVAYAKDDTKPTGDPERFGNTYEQSVSALKRINEYLNEEGIGLKDVISMKVYVAPDPNNEGKPDFQAWFKAYGEFFNNESNPNKVARSTIGVYTLVNPDMLIEIEVRAVYPSN
jgi:enamine deaminase RidA (YjgF/YER057c/UK114 family)